MANAARKKPSLSRMIIDAEAMHININRGAVEAENSCVLAIRVMEEMSRAKNKKVTSFKG